MNAGQRQRLRAAIDRSGDRLTRLEERLSRLELALFGTADVAALSDRVEALEGALLSPRSFGRRELDRQRRAAVLHARERGLSIQTIALALGLGSGTVAAIINTAEGPLPDRVVGLDGRSHPATHDWGPNGARANNGRAPA